MSGRQVYISPKHHRRLKMASALTDRPMNDIVEECIDNLDIDGLDQIDPKKLA